DGGGGGGRGECGGGGAEGGGAEDRHGEPVGVGAFQRSPVEKMHPCGRDRRRAPRQSLVTGRHFDLLAEGEHGGDSCWLGGQRKAQVKYKIDVSRMALPRRSRSRATTFAPLPPGRAALARAGVQACGEGVSRRRSPPN